MNDSERISPSRIRQIVSLIDLTNLNEDCDKAAIDSLCSNANIPAGQVAAICIWPDFVSYASAQLGAKSNINIATVVNFPTGDEPVSSTCEAIEKAIDQGANEIDYVLPYKALINGDSKRVVTDIQAVRKAIPAKYRLKVILETGELESNELIDEAANIAIDNGADFIKTSTGKVPVNATHSAAITMLDVIAKNKHHVGFKAAGGIKTVSDANAYLVLSEERLGEHWPDSKHFRFGASGLLQDALIKLDMQSAPVSESKENY